MNLMSQKMIGKHAPEGPGGKNCVCCNDAPGKGRKIRKRQIKRSERGRWKQSIRRDEW